MSEHAALVRLAPALVGTPAAGLLLRRLRGDVRRRGAAGALRELRRRAPPGRGRARHLVQLGAVAVRRPRLARRDARARGLLPDRCPGHGPGHHLPLGRPDGDDGARVHGRHPVHRRLHHVGDPGARRPADVEDRSAPGSTRSTRSTSTAPTPCASACSRCPRPRTSATRRRRSSRGATWRTRCGTRRASCCSTRGERRTAGPSTEPDRGPLDPLAPGADDRAPYRSELDAYDFAHAALSLYEFFWSELCDWYLEIVKPRLYDGDADAAANLLHVLEQRSRAGAPDDAVRHRGDLGAICPGARRGPPLVISPYPEADDSLHRRGGRGRARARTSTLTAAIRRWRDLAGVRRGRGARARAGRAAARARRAAGAHRVLGRRRRASRSRASARWRSWPRRESTPSGSRELGSTSAARARVRGGAGRGQARERAIRRARRPRRWSRRSARSSTAIGPSSRSSAELDVRRRRGIPRLAASPSAGGSGSTACGGWSRLLGSPQHRFASIHVVGTNGKSSVTAMTAALLEANGMRTGAYLSPHVERWTERIRVGGHEIAATRSAPRSSAWRRRSRPVNRTAGRRGLGHRVRGRHRRRVRRPGAAPGSRSA